MGCDLSDDLPRLIIDPGVAAKIAGIVVGHFFIGFYSEVQVLQELSDVFDFQS